MKQGNFKKETPLETLVFEYEAMSQQGTVGFYEEAVFLEIAEYYENRNMIEEALAAISHAIDQNSYSPLLLVRKARLLLEKGCEVQSLEYLDKAELLAPTEKAVKMLKIEVMVELGQLNHAMALIRELEHHDEDNCSGQLYFLKGLILEHKRKYVSMFKALKKAVKSNPNNTEALKKLWLSVELSGRFEESIELHAALTEQEPYNALIWYNLGYAYYRLKDYDEAEQAFEYACYIDKNFQDAYRDCAEVRIQKKDFEGALDCYEDMLALFQPDAELYINIGYCYEQQEKIDLALTCYEKAFNHSCINDKAYYRKGACLLKKSQLEQAITCFEQACAIEKNKEQYMIALAEAYYLNGEEDKANTLYYQATGAAPDMCEPWVLYAQFLLSKGNTEEALELMDEADIYAVGVELIYCRAACLLKAKDYDKGIPVLNQALKQCYKKHYILFDICADLKDDIAVLVNISMFNK